MSIATAIANAQSKVADAYTACNSKGATMPAAGSQNLSNLATTISSITTGSTPNLTALSVTPTTSAQTLTPTSPVDGYDEVNVSAVTSAIDANITAENIKNGVSILGVAGICGRNFVSGSFTTNSSSGVQTVTIPYTGSGYPLVAIVFVTGGVSSDNATWYQLIKQGAVGVWAMTKTYQNSTPTYATSGDANAGNCILMYKSSSTSATSYGRTGNASANTYTTTNASSAASTTIRFKSATTMSVYVVGSSNYGLAQSCSYTYFIIYSS